MKSLIMAIFLFCLGCLAQPASDYTKKLSSGLEMTIFYCYEGTSYAINKSYQKALKPLALFPEANVFLPKAADLISDLEKHKRKEMESWEYLKIRHKEKYEKAILELADKYNQGRQLADLNAHEALILISQIVRGQFSDSGIVDSEVLLDISRLYETLGKRSSFHYTCFDLVNLDEYFLGAYKKIGYRCGMVSWNAVYIYDLLKKSIPALSDVYMFECGTRGPAHSFNLLISCKKGHAGIYMIDFQKENFWKPGLKILDTPSRIFYQLDMSDLGISRLDR